jgi:hypothetical protein
MLPVAWNIGRVQSINYATTGHQQITAVLSTCIPAEKTDGITVIAKAAWLK